MKKVVLSIDGMTCSACSNGLEKYLNKQNGIKSATVNLVMANALIEYDENILNLETLEKFVEETGFKSLGIYNENSEKKQNKNEKVTGIESCIQQDEKSRVQTKNLSNFLPFYTTLKLSKFQGICIKNNRQIRDFAWWKGMDFLV